MPSLLILFLLSMTVASTTPDGRNSKAALAKVAPAKVAPAKVAPAQTAVTTTVVSIPSVSAPPAVSSLSPEAALLVARLEAATQGLPMQSETDAPFRVVFWPSQKMTLGPGEIALLAEQKADSIVEIQKLEQFFAGAVSIEDWMKEDEKTTARRFENLVKILNAELENPQVYLIGARERTVVIIGKLKGGFGGIITLVVET